MAIAREVEERLITLQRGLAGVSNRLKFAERRTRAIRLQNFVNNFLGGLTDLGTLGFISSHLDFKEAGVPANPDSGFRRLFADVNTNKLSIRTSGGATIVLEYLDADAIAAVEGEATLDLTGDVTIAGDKSLKVDVIDEQDSGAGVTIENVTAKDGTLELHHGTDTISSDQIASPTGGYIIAAAQAGTADDLDGIGGGAYGRVIVVRADAGDTITVKHANAGASSGNKIFMNDNADLTLVGNDDDNIVLMYDESLDSAAGGWFELSRGNSGTAYTDAEALAAALAGASISDNTLLRVDGTSNSGEYARFTAAGLVGRTEAEFKADFNLQIGTDVLAERTIGIANNNLVKIDSASVADDEYARFTANGLESRSVTEVLSDIGAAAAAHAMSTHSDEDSYNISTSGTATFGDLTLQGSFIQGWDDLTISSGQVAVTKLMHTLAGEGGAADNLVGMSGGSDGMMVIVHAVSDSVTITLKHNDVGGESSNGTRLFMANGADVTLDDIDDLVIVIFDSSLDTGGAWIVQTSGAYTDAEAIAAVEGEATLALSGAVEVTGVLTVDVINEKTGAAGVTIDGLLIKDEYIEFDEIAAPDAGAGNKGRLYVGDESADSMPFFVSDSGDVFNLTRPYWVPVGPLSDSDWETAGSGTIVTDIRTVRVASSASAGFTARARTPRTNASISRGVATAVIAWGQRIAIWVRFYISDTSTNGQVYFTLGKDSTTYNGDLTNAGIGFRVDNLAFKGHVHDGTSATTTATLSTLSEDIVYDVLIINRGDGTVEWFINNASVGTDANGPSADGVGGDTVFQCEAKNNADSAQNAAVFTDIMFMPGR